LHKKQKKRRTLADFSMPGDPTNTQKHEKQQKHNMQHATYSKLDRDYLENAVDRTRVAHHVVVFLPVHFLQDLVDLLHGQKRLRSRRVHIQQLLQRLHVVVVDEVSDERVARLVRKPVLQNIQHIGRLQVVEVVIKQIARELMVVIGDATVQRRDLQLGVLVDVRHGDEQSVLVIAQHVEDGLEEVEQVLAADHVQKRPLVVDVVVAHPAALESADCFFVADRVYERLHEVQEVVVVHVFVFRVAFEADSDPL